MTNSSADCRLDGANVKEIAANLYGLQEAEVHTHMHTCTCIHNNI